jgi:hypothetical protein
MKENYHAAARAIKGLGIRDELSLRPSEVGRLQISPCADLAHQAPIYPPELFSRAV